tara:strand:+ start:313 stop:474 length:162 start_codon:yes stop_codon:yes gene_type:complete
MDIGADAKGGRDHAPQRSRREGRSSKKAEKIGEKAVSAVDSELLFLLAYLYIN